MLTLRTLVYDPLQSERHSCERESINAQRVKPNLPIELSNRLPNEQSKQILAGSAEELLSPDNDYGELNRKNQMIRYLLQKLLRKHFSIK